MSPCLLTPDEVKQYTRDGYLVLDDVFTFEECELAYAMYQRYSAPDFRAIMNLYRGVVEYDGEVPRAVASEDIAHEIALIRNRTIVAALKDLQGAEVACLQTMFLFKKARSPYAVQAWNPHQDNAYAQAAWGMYITGNIALQDQDPENGCMYIFPGSHREPLLPAERMKSFHEDPGKNPGHKVEVPRRYEKVELHLRRGSVLFLHGNVIHGSYPNLSDRDRPMLLIPYITKGAEFIPGQRAKREPFPVYEGQIV